MFPYDIQLAGIFVYRSAWPWSAYTAENPTGAYYPPRIEPKNSRRGAMEKNVDFRVGKMFRLGSKVQASLFWEMFNAFNWTNYNGMNTLIDDTATFGLYNSAADMRRQQLGFRIDF
jgi:hypothetical protein